jgi:hypothetical protein
VTKSFYLGVELVYDKMQSATSFNGLIPTNIGTTLNAAPAATAANTTVGGASENAWNVTVRMHKDFLP